MTVENSKRSQIIFSLFILAFLLFLSVSSAQTEILCSYAGPDVSEDLLRLTDFNITGPSPLKEGDTILVKFKLQNYGQTNLKLGPKGIFVVARDPNNSDVSFGFTRANTDLKVGETVSINASKVLDKAGTWKIWPSYQILVGKEYKLGPDNWHSCVLSVIEAIIDSDKDGIPDQQDKCPKEPETYNKYQDEDGCPDTLPVKDSDKDGINDDKDNCPQVYNPDQKNGDGDAFGDVCDDSDGDKIMDNVDNCIFIKNSDQKDIDNDGIGDVCDNCDNRDTDKDGLINCLDKCPNEPETKNNYQDNDGCPDEAPKEVPKVKDTIPPTVTISHLPLEVNTTSNVTFTAIARDNTGVAKIIIYVQGNKVKECAPPDFAKDYWRCVHKGGPFPAGVLTYRAEAFDLDNNKVTSLEGRINIQTITIEGPPIIEGPQRREEIGIPCSISGKLLDFRYLSKTVKVKFCEAETIGGTCLPTPPFTCFPLSHRCKEGGRVWYEEVRRILPGEETYGNPGPLAYQASVSCDGSYLIEPVYQPFGEECEWQGTWRPTKANFLTMAGESVRDYDFRFNPLNTVPPRTYVLTTNPQPPATFKGEGNFNLLVGAADPQGIKRIKVTGNYQISFFQSDESGPRIRQVVPPPPPISKECNSSPCEIPIPYYENGKSINFDLRLSACDNAGNKVETTYNRTFPDDEPGDLSIVSAEPVQVIYDPPGAPLMKLVKNKNTAFRVKINSTFPHPVETSFRLALSTDYWGLTSKTGNFSLLLPEDWRFPEIWGPIKIPANARNYSVMLPIIADWQKERDATALVMTGVLRGRGVDGIYGPDVRIMPVPKADRVSFSVEINPDGAVREMRSGGNTWHSPRYEVVKTRPWRILFMPYLTDSCVPVEAEVKSNAKRQLEYVLATFPIAENKLQYGFSTAHFTGPCEGSGRWECPYTRSWPFNMSRGEFLLWVGELAAMEGYDFGVAVGCGGGGGAGGSDRAVFFGARDTREELLAHEMMHAIAGIGDIYYFDCYSSWDESYCQLPDGDRFYCCWRHYDNEKEIRENNGVNPRRGCVIDCGQDWNECDRGCCKARCEEACNEAGGNVYDTPDTERGIINMPAADGFWVNKWLKKEGKQYFMDSPSGDNWISARSIRQEGYHFCPGTKVDGDGYLNLLRSPKFVSATDPEGLLVSGMINKNGTVKLRPFVYLPETFLDIEPGTKGDYYFVLLDKDNKVLSKSGFDVYFYQSDPQGGPIDEVGFVYRIEWKEGTKKIELQDKTGKVLASRDVSENKPEVKVISPNGGEVFTQGKKIKIKWQASDKDGDILTYSLSLSRDNGENWLPVDIDIQTNEYELNTLGLEAGDYLVKVRATDGVNSAEDVSDGAFKVRTAKKIPITYILGALVLVLAIGIIVYRFKLLEILKKRKVEEK